MPTVFKSQQAPQDEASIAKFCVDTAENGSLFETTARAVLGTDRLFYTTDIDTDCKTSRSTSTYVIIAVTLLRRFRNDVLCFSNVSRFQEEKQIYKFK